MMSLWYEKGHRSGIYKAELHQSSALRRAKIELHVPMSLTIEVAAGTDIGRVRANNEDNFGYDRRHGIYVVCDGMGGQAAGEVASRIAVDTVLEHFDRPRTSGICAGSGQAVVGISGRGNALACAFQRANRAIC